MAGWTWFYIGLGLAFFFVGDSGWMAAVFWWSIAITNEVVERW